jgi:hypothetical protein
MNCPECGCEFRRGWLQMLYGRLAAMFGEIEKPRSPPQHRRMFKLIRVAYTHWPEGYKFQPETSDHLRSWLLIHARYSEIETLLDEWPEAAIEAIEARFKEHRPYTWRVPIEGGSALYGPRSMRFDKMSHKEACKVFNDMEEIICSVLNVESGDALLEEDRQAA